jgi:hypothetical protein
MVLPPLSGSAGKPAKLQKAILFRSSRRLLGQAKAIPTG